MAESKGKDIGAKKDEFFLLTALIFRRIAYPFALLFCRLGVPANAVTIMGGVLWVASAVAMVLAGWLPGSGHAVAGYWLLGFSLLAVNLGVILDVADGSVARITGTASSAGYFLDYVFHLVFHPMYLCSIGIFLFLTDGQVAWLILGVLSICAGWGASFSAKEHVLCDHIANNRVDLSEFSDEERYSIYLDSPGTRQAVTEKVRKKRFAVVLLKELLMFPGQYTTFSVVILLDLVLNNVVGRSDYILLKLLFSVICLFSIVRVPFRIAREFKTLVGYDRIKDSRQ